MEKKNPLTVINGATFLEFVRRHHLQVPALLALELQRPLGFFSAQLLIFTRPFLGLFGNAARFDSWTHLLEEPGALDHLIAALQQPGNAKEEEQG